MGNNAEVSSFRRVTEQQNINETETDTSYLIIKRIKGICSPDFKNTVDTALKGKRRVVLQVSVRAEKLSADLQFAYKASLGLAVTDLMLASSLASTKLGI